MPEATTASSSIPTELIVAVAVVLTVLVALLLWIAFKGRPFGKGDVFRASRWSKGNHVFPTQVLITPSSVVHYTPNWVGHVEHSIHMAHVASVSIKTHVLFSDVYIETTGGTTPIQCRGHRKHDAVRMKQLIEQHQTAYYRQAGREGAPAPAGIAGTDSPAGIR